MYHGIDFHEKTAGVLVVGAALHLDEARRRRKCSCKTRFILSYGLLDNRRGSSGLLADGLVDDGLGLHRRRLGRRGGERGSRLGFHRRSNRWVTGSQTLKKWFLRRVRARSRFEAS